MGTMSHFLFIHKSDFGEFGDFGDCFHETCVCVCVNGTRFKLVACCDIFLLHFNFQSIFDLLILQTSKMSARKLKNVAHQRMNGQSIRSNRDSCIYMLKFVCFMHMKKETQIYSHTKHTVKCIL